MDVRSSLAAHNATKNLCWYIAGTMLALCWHSPGTMLTLCWHSVGSLLALWWYYTGTLLALLVHWWLNELHFCLIYIVYMYILQFPSIKYISLTDCLLVYTFTSILPPRAMILSWVGKKHAVRLWVSHLRSSVSAYPRSYIAIAGVNHPARRGILPPDALTSVYTNTKLISSVQARLFFTGLFWQPSIWCGSKQLCSILIIQHGIYSKTCLRPTVTARALSRTNKSV